MPLFLRLPVTSAEICPPCFKNKWNTRDSVNGTWPTICGMPPWSWTNSLGVVWVIRRWKSPCLINDGIASQNAALRGDENCLELRDRSHLCYKSIINYDLDIANFLVISPQIRYIEVFDLTNPRFNEQIWSVPSDFVKSRFHCICGVLWFDLVFSSIFLHFNLTPLCLRPEPLWTLKTTFFRSRDQPRP